MTKVFLDSSVLLAACISSSGGSFRLCEESHNGRLKLVINRYVQEEVEGVLERKYPEKFEQLHNLLKWSEIIVNPNPSAKLVKQMFSIIDPKDAPVLAGAIKAKVNFLITLDRKDFLTKKLQTARLPLIIVIPQTFFQEHW